MDRRRGRRVRSPWAELLKRVFAIDVLVCEHCGGRRRVLKFICKPSAIERILRHLGLPTQAPARAPPRGVQGVFEYE